MEIEYKNPEDFLRDDSFIEWAKNSSERSITYWQNWINNNPDKREAAYKARNIYHSCFVQEVFQPAQVDEAEQNLFNHLKLINNRSIVYKLYNKRWWLIAASLFFIVTGFGLWQYYTTHASVKTNYGQMAERILPDGSQVMLNANSSIIYNKWKENTNREVWLKGEAFFHIKKTADHRRFIVHANHFDIIVTGTQFNVVNRNNKNNVLLTEGSVTLQQDNGNKVLMRPGDFVEINNDAFVKKEEKKENVLAWKEHKLYFDNIPMSEAAKMIEEQYGVSVKLADDSTASKTISGILPNNNLDLLLSSLEATADFKIIHNNNEIIIQRP